MTVIVRTSDLPRWSPTFLPCD